MNEEDLLEAAMGLIANAGWDSFSGNVSLEKSPGWHEAALEWRKEYTNYLAQKKDDLPEFDELTDIDKGAVIYFLSACESEGIYYALENYPAQFVDNEILVSLDSAGQSNYVLNNWEDLEELELGWAEEDRLVNLYLEAMDR